MPLAAVRTALRSVTTALRALAGASASAAKRLRSDRRGTIAIIAAVSAMPLAIAAGVAIDMSRLADARSALQRAADNAALSGAAAYVLYTEGDAYNAIAQNTARSAFCNAVTALPAGFSLVSAGAPACTNTPGAAVSAAIAGYSPGTRGIKANSGCSATNTVVSGVTCGFVVTVSASATVPTTFRFLMNGAINVPITATAINPFINLANALTPSFAGSAINANSLWVYPLLLDANGAPDFSTNAGALPNASSCTGNPTQTYCGSYTMLASTAYYNGCPASNPCNVNGTIFINGIVQNPVVSNAVITATTPLGVAMQSAAGGVPGSSVGYVYYNQYYSSPKPADSGCSYGYPLAYQTFSQYYDANGYPLEVDGNGNWNLSTHWMYSSFLANGDPPDQNEIANQLNTTINPATGYSYATQIVPAVPTNGKGYVPSATKATPTACPNPYSTSNPQNAQPVATNYPTTGATNCALYIVKDPASTSPNPNYANNNVCFSPSGTPGYQYAALSCQNYAGHKYAFFWNDMGGNTDDTDYNNGTLVISCAGASYVLLIN